MKKEYAIDVKGEIEGLKDLLMNHKEIRMGSIRDYLSVGVPEFHKNNFVKVKQLIEEYSKHNQISYSYAFRASDFTPEDLETCSALMVHFPVFGEQEFGRTSHQLIVENNGFSKIFICDHCGMETPSWDGTGTIILSSKKKFSYPFFEIPYGGVIFRNDIMETIQQKVLSSGIHIRECSIKTQNTISDKYYAIFPQMDLGEPVGDMEFLDPCPVCVSRNIHHKREFLWSFRKDLFDSLNFAWTSWFPGGTIIVSFLVYLILSKIPDAKEKYDEMFEPIALI